MRLTRRGKVVIGIALVLAFWGLLEVSAHLWWVGSGWCWGTMLECEV